MSINVLIADDEELITNSLKMILDYEDDINVLFICQNGDEAYEKVLQNNNIHVVLMDIRMPVCDGVLSTKKILKVRPDIKIIILTTFNDDEYIFEALKNGAKGYLLKNIKADEIINAIRIVHEGNLLVHPEVATKLSSMLKADKKKLIYNLNLSETEIEIIKLISDGLSNREIAKKIFLTEGTVKNKITDILSKLKLRDRTQIAIFYLKNFN
jgi:DNA-binding NarL/FixJ family response regulator